MGLGEQGGKVATSVVEGLKAQPLALGLIVVIVVFIGFVTWLLSTLNERTVEQYRQKDAQTNELLKKLDTISEVRTEVAKNTALGSKINDMMERLSKGFDDHEKRIRDLEQRK